LLSSVENTSTPEDSDAFQSGIVPAVELEGRPESRAIIGLSEAMLEVFSLVDRVADSDSSIMIYGESGTGKELVARAIHQSSARENEAFVAINCGAIPENLLESELFGHVRGAFTGATSPKVGKFERADGGTIFLDEIGDMSPELQVKLLRVLEEREVERVGGSKTVKVDVRVIAATHRDLESAVEKGAFRQDLFYRLEVIPVTLPALKERTSDIPLLISHFLEIFNREKSRAVTGFSEEAVELMTSYPWPGNVRELRNMVERLVVLKGSGEISIKDLPRKLKGNRISAELPRVEISQDGICLNSAVSEFEKALIVQSLERTKWVKNKAAKLLQLNRTTLVEKIKRHKLQEGVM
jgi:sigma-54 dependent transcriptional regulator, flagellar regulatory protein